MTAALITPIDAPRHPRWPAERFYWALVEAPGYTARGELPPGLRPALEEQVPVPVETLHAVVAPASNGALLVCAAAKSELESLAGDALSLTPAALPAFAVDLGIAPDDLNLLVGALEPRAIRRGRACRRLAALTAVVLCAALISVGLLRRAEHWVRQAAAAETALANLLMRCNQSSADALALELARVERLAQPAEIPSIPDASIALASLLSAWPAQAPSKPQSIAVNPAGISVSVTVEDDPGPFLRAFNPPAGWTLDEPRLNSAGALTRLSLQLRRGTPEGKP